MNEHELDEAARAEFDREWKAFRDGELAEHKAARLRPNKDEADAAPKGAIFTPAIGTVPRNGPGEELLHKRCPDILADFEEQLYIERLYDPTRNLKIIVRHGCVIVEGIVGQLVVRHAPPLIGALKHHARNARWWRGEVLRSWENRGFARPDLGVGSTVALALWNGLTAGDPDVEAFVAARFPKSYAGSVASGAFYYAIELVRDRFRNPTSHPSNQGPFTLSDYHELSRLVWDAETYSDWYYFTAVPAPAPGTPGVFNHLAH